MSDRILALEEQLAYLTRTVEELSDVIARQDREIDRLTSRQQMLMEREALADPFTRLRANDSQGFSENPW
ncbi:MAG: SlyX family protein [Maritimibacter sp.]